jgi:DNA-binding beta-propeller fold protein YncE
MQPRTLAASQWTGIFAGLIALHLGSGCGSDDGPGNGMPDAPPGSGYCVPDILPRDPGNVPAGVSIVFPPASSLTEAGAITVRGTARLDTDVAAIRVNGVAATSTDGFRHWQVSVPLQLGANTLAVESEDAAGQIDPAAAQVAVAMSPAPMLAPTAVTLDAPRNRALVIDAGRNALLVVDLATGSRAIVYQPPDMAGAGVSAVRPHVPGLPPAFPLVDAALLDGDGQRALVVAQGALFRVELASGKDTVISDGEVGSGPAFVKLVDAALDAERGRALVVDAGLNALLAVDLTTGARSVISDSETGSGPALEQVSALALDAAAGRALVTVENNDDAALLAVDLATGARSLISSQARGSGPALRTPEDVALDAAGNRALITDSTHGGLVAVDLATGDRAILSGAATAGGPGLELPDGVALDTQQGRALLVDEARDLLVAVDLATGGRTLLSGETVGSGPELHTPYALALDRRARRVIVGDLAGAALVAVDLASGARTVLSSDEVGQGPSLGTVQAVDVQDAGGERILVANSYDGLLMAVDPATGTRTVVSGNGVGSGPPLTGASSLVFDDYANRAIVAVNEGIMVVSLNTGDRTLLASGLEYVTWLHLDVPCDQVFLASGSTNDHGLFAMRLDEPQLVRVSDYHACTEVPAGVVETPAYDPITGRVLGWHDLITALMAVDTQTGACTTQVTPVIEGGGSWPYPHRAMLVDPDTGLLLLADDVSKALMALDPETGERVIVSR